jgi:hypothetical protein
VLAGKSQPVERHNLQSTLINPDENSEKDGATNRAVGYKLKHLYIAATRFRHCRGDLPMAVSGLLRCVLRRIYLALTGNELRKPTARRALQARAQRPQSGDRALQRERRIFITVQPLTYRQLSTFISAVSSPSRLMRKSEPT